MTNALHEAVSLKMDCVQVFTKNQRQWNTKPLADDDINAWLSKLRKIGWDNKNRVVSHNSYLVNLASPDQDARKKSIGLQREELERCETLHIPMLVSHPGARLGTPRKREEQNALSHKPSCDEIEGLKRIVCSLDQLHQELAGYTTITCLETTVGAGTNLGYDFQHLSWIREHVAEPQRVAFCFDTCHITGAGYDMSTKKSATQVLRTFDDTAGLRHIKVFHFNDSVGAIGSRIDRHAHIGEGTCGLSCFRAILDDPLFDAVPKILETPKEENEKCTPMDSVNVRKLRRMARMANNRR